MNEDAPPDDRGADDDQRSAIEAAEDQYAALTTGDGDTIVYDRQNPDAWIQSTFAVDVGAVEGDETSA